MRFGLTARILIAGGIVVVFLLAEFVFVVHSFQSVRRSTRTEQHEEQSVVAAIQVEQLVVDLQTGSRGFVISHRASFLRPWSDARAQLPEQSQILMTLSPGPATTRIDAAWRSYLEHWSLPIVQLARRDPQAAQRRIASGDGQQIVDGITRLIEPFVQSNLATAKADRAAIADDEHFGVVIGVSGIAIIVLLFIGIIGYFLRVAIAPLRHIADAAVAVAAGDLDVTVPESGAGEVGQLAVSFNEMSRSLERQQRSLEEQNIDLERLANVLRAVLDSTLDGILLSDAEGNVQLANRPLVELSTELGMRFEGSVVDRLLSIADRIVGPDSYREAMERLRDNADESSFDEFVHAPSGRVFQGWTAPVHDDRGGFVGRIWTMRDVTQQRELDRMKDEFVATVSHELRTPLTSMMGFLEMIREGEAGKLTDEQKRFLAIVYRSSERLQRLVGDLLFVARLDAGGIQLQLGDARVDEILGEAIEAVEAIARSRDVAVESLLEPVPPVVGDRERLLQLFGNLLSNALKFTPAGGRVTARTFRADGYVVAEVSDTGIGIPEAEQVGLFQRFFRSSTAMAQAIPGTGLGLVISKAIAEAHGGSITVRSQSGQGTCFRVELPLERQDVAA